MNINHSYNASKLHTASSNMALVSTTFLKTWNTQTGERVSQPARDLAKAGRDLYQHAKEYFEAINEITKKSKTLQSQRVAKDIASVNKRLGDTLEKSGTEVFKQAAENAHKAAKAMTNAKLLLVWQSWLWR